jgi:hypothetical protein
MAPRKLGSCTFARRSDPRQRSGRPERLTLRRHGVARAVAGDVIRLRTPRSRHFDDADQKQDAIDRNAGEERSWFWNILGQWPASDTTVGTFGSVAVSTLHILCPRRRSKTMTRMSSAITVDALWLSRPDGMRGPPRARLQSLGWGSGTARVHAARAPMGRRMSAGWSL